MYSRFFMFAILALSMATIDASSVNAQGTFAGRGAGQIAGGPPPAYGVSASKRIENVTTNGVTRWGDALFTVTQVIDSNNARMSVQAGQRVGRGLTSHGKPLDFWFEGPTGGFIDGKIVEELPETRLVGTKTYTTLAGSNTILHVKNFSVEELEKIQSLWRESNPNHVTLKTKRGASAEGNILSVEKGQIAFEMLGETVSFKLSSLDGKSKKVARKWLKDSRTSEANP